MMPNLLREYCAKDRHHRRGREAECEWRRSPTKLAERAKDFCLENGTWILDYPAAIFRMALSTVLFDPDEVTWEAVIAGERTRNEYLQHFQEKSYRDDCEDCLRVAIEARPSEEE
jgi:hypothetical protein